MTDDLYAGFADRYDLFHGEFGQHDPEQASFFQQLLAQHQVRTILDCACGTGQHLHLFHTLGYQVTGSDISPSMLAQARKNLAGSDIQVPLHQIDYRELPQHLTTRFDAVTCLSSSLLHMEDNDQVFLALRSMRAVLRRGGILVLTQGTTDRQWAEKPRFILAANTSDFSRLFAIDYLDTGARYNIVDIHRGGDRKELEVWSVEYPHVLLHDDQKRLLRVTGFAPVEFFGSYRFEPYDKGESRVLIAVAQRR
jgi:ubiquinone/menaquinone biosynthesis C-methylase UbiE